MSGVQTAALHLSCGSMRSSTCIPARQDRTGRHLQARLEHLRQFAQGRLFRAGILDVF